MSGDIQCLETRVGTFYAFRNDVVTNHLARFGAHTGNELAMLLAHLRPGDTVLDIGAHIGTYTVPIARHVGPRGRVLSIEARRETFDLLARNIQANHLEAVAVPHWAIATDQPGRFEAVTKESNTGATYFQRAEGTAAMPSIVPDRWDALGDRRVDGIKIDVEGMECSVLMGCAGLLRRWRPVLYVEINGPGLKRVGAQRAAIESLLGECGYHYFRNVGERNSTNERFEVARLDSLEQGGEFFDLLAVAEGSDRYPSAWQPFDPALLRRHEPSFPRRVYRAFCRRASALVGHTLE